LYIGLGNEISMLNKYPFHNSLSEKLSPMEYTVISNSYIEGHTLTVKANNPRRILISYDRIYTKPLWKYGSSVLIGVCLLTMSTFVVILSTTDFHFRDALSSLNNENTTTIGAPKIQDEILGNTSTNGDQPDHPSFKKDIYYQVKTGSILNPISISSAGDRINNILYDNDQRSIILVLTPGQNKSDIIKIDLPRNIIDSRIDEEDKNFTVLVNNQPAKYKEIIDKMDSNISSSSVGSNTSSGEYTLDNDSRKLVIEFGKDARVIKIIGTEPNNITSQNQSGSNISKSNDIQGDDQSPFFLIPIILFILGIIIAVVYFTYRRRRVKSSK
jgi:hypothetical protein